jgi:hypothetical protein
MMMGHVKIDSPRQDEKLPEATGTMVVSQVRMEMNT